MSAPKFREGPVRVVVPASSANLGPGFDSMGLALGVVDEYLAMVSEDPGVLVEVDGEGSHDVPRDESHLVVRSMNIAFDHMGGRPPGFVVRCTNGIPHGRGLGSSASAIIGGMVLARALVESGPETFSDDELLTWALEQESHPDNLSAALFGGLTVAWVDESGSAGSISVEVHPDVRCIVAVPPHALPTREARVALGAQVDRADAVHNVARSALLLHAMTVEPRHLMEATRDRLHQDARAQMYPDSYALMNRIRDVGIPAAISGAGPSLIAFISSDEQAAIVGEFAPKEWIVREVSIAQRGAHEVALPQ